MQQGLLRGQERRTTLNKIKYYAFRGIPYGKPPVGSLRFKVNHISKSVII